jgi:hypothetical protein
MEDKDQTYLLFESCRTVLHCYLDLATAATTTSPTVSLVSYTASRSPLVSSTAGGEWTADLLITEGLGIIGRLWGERLGPSTMAQVNNCTGVADPHWFQRGSILGQMRSGFRVLMTKNFNFISQLKKILLKKLAIFVVPKLNEGRPSYKKIL